MNKWKRVRASVNVNYQQNPQYGVEWSTSRIVETCWGHMNIKWHSDFHVTWKIYRQDGCRVCSERGISEIVIFTVIVSTLLCQVPYTTKRKD